MTQQDRKRRVGPQRTWARVQPRPGYHPWPLLPPTRHEVTPRPRPRPPFAPRSLCQVSRSLCVPSAAPTAPATPAGPSAITADNHQSPHRLHPGLRAPAFQPSSYASPGPRQTYLAETKHDPVAAAKVRRSTRSPHLLCALCGTPAQETSPLAPQTEGMCLPAD